jgi:hypothetical protein
MLVNIYDREVATPAPVNENVGIRIKYNTPEKNNPIVEMIVLI